LIIVKLQGGLGNQMFQYAAARAISNNNQILFDTNFLTSNTKTTSSFTPRKLELSVFKNIKIQVAYNLTIYILKKSAFVSRYLKSLFFIDAKIISEAENGVFVNLSRGQNATVYLDGYFQNENNFKVIRKQLLHDFKFPLLTDAYKNMESKIRSISNSISIHVRRGDYLKPEVNIYHGTLPPIYYQKAQKRIEERVSCPHYFIFSDDPDWCRSNLLFLANDATIVSETNHAGWEDMYLMSLCQHHIIANSTYSWWGAWLNENPYKIVIAPDKWFATLEADIVPDEWIKI
jgi:hypothetical protein